MPMSRTGLSSLMGYQEGGGINTILDEYQKDYESVQKSAFDPSALKERIQAFSQYLPMPRQESIYDLISDLGKGLLAQQTQKMPSLGLGLAYGFNLYKEAADKKKEEAKKISNTLFSLALKDYEADRDNEQKFKQSLVDKKYDLILEDMKNTGKMFQSKNPTAEALNFILTAEKNPTLKYKPDGSLTNEYAIAKAFVEKPQVQYVNTELGIQPVQRPGFNLEQIFPTQPIENKTTINVGDMFPSAPYLSYQLQLDGKTFLNTADGKTYVWNPTKQIMEPTDA